MKKIIMIAYILICVSCGSGTQNSGDNNNFYGNNHWKELPILVAVQTDADQYVIDLYNEIFSSEIFKNDQNGIHLNRIDTIDHDPAALGFADVSTDDNGIIISAYVEIINDVSDDEYKQLLAHELGHVLGCGHIDGTIMNPDPIDGADLKSLIESKEFFDWVSNEYQLGGK